MPFDNDGPRGHMTFDDVRWDQILVIGPILIVLLLLAYLAWSSVYTVQVHEKAIVMRFGKYHTTVDPGLRFCIPLVDQVVKVSVEERSLRLPMDPRQQQPLGAQDPSLFLTGDLDAVLVEWTVQWQVTDPYNYSIRFYREDDPGYAERVLTSVAQTVMNRLVGDYSIDEVLTEGRGEIGEEARQATQRILDDYSCGIGIRDLQLQRTTPPSKVQPAYEQVNASEQQRAQLKNEADKERNKLLPEAEAEKDKLINEALGYAKRRWAESDGEITALLAKYQAYEKAPDVTRQRLYIEAMESVLSKVQSKVLIDAELQGTLPVLPLGEGATP